MKRFDLNANTTEGAITYIRNRALQISHTGVKLLSIETIEYGVVAKFEFNGEFYFSFYILEQFRGKGKFYEIWSKYNSKFPDLKMLTTSLCNLAQYFRYKKIPFILFNGLTNTCEYKLIQDTYDDKCANRSGVYLMNHIDEGLYILNKINASYYAKLGYIIHPLFQSDDDLTKSVQSKIECLNTLGVINTIEYRNIANDYLSNKEIQSINDIKLSSLKDVNDMLIADKIQNRKDFELYHLGKHERSNELVKYFANWCERLNITEEFYQETKQELIKLNNENKENKSR